MSFLRTKEIPPGSGRYYLYLVSNHREGDSVRQTVEEYRGRAAGKSVKETEGAITIPAPAPITQVQAAIETATAPKARRPRKFTPAVTQEEYVESRTDELKGLLTPEDLKAVEATFADEYIDKTSKGELFTPARPPEKPKKQAEPKAKPEMVKTEMGNNENEFNKLVSQIKEAYTPEKAKVAREALNSRLSGLRNQTIVRKGSKAVREERRALEAAGFPSSQFDFPVSKLATKKDFSKAINEANIFFRALNKVEDELSVETKPKRPAEKKPEIATPLETETKGRKPRKPTGKAFAAAGFPEEPKPARASLIKDLEEADRMREQQEQAKPTSSLVESYKVFEEKQQAKKEKPKKETKPKTKPSAASMGLEEADKMKEEKEYLSGESTQGEVHTYKVEPQTTTEKPAAKETIAAIPKTLASSGVVAPAKQPQSYKLSPEMNKYIRSTGNEAKKNYAQRYAYYLAMGSKTEPMRGKLTNKEAQEIRSQVYKIQHPEEKTTEVYSEPIVTNAESVVVNAEPIVVNAEPIVVEAKPATSETPVSNSERLKQIEKRMSELNSEIKTTKKGRPTASQLTRRKKAQEEFSELSKEADKIARRIESKETKVKPMAIPEVKPEPPKEEPPVEIKKRWNPIVPEGVTPEQHLKNLNWEIKNNPQNQNLIGYRESFIAKYKDKLPSLTKSIKEETVDSEASEAEEDRKYRVAEEKAEKESETIRETLSSILDEEKKSQSIKKLEKELAKLDYDKYEGLEDIENSIEEYRSLERSGMSPEEYNDEKASLFEEITSAIESVEAVVEEEEDEVPAATPVVKKPQKKEPTVFLPRTHHPAGGYEEKPAVFLRFGRVPEGGRSGQYGEEGKLEKYEKGTSVYKAWYDPKTDKYVIETPNAEITGTQQSFIAELASGKKKIYQVTGEEIDDSGGDLESLLNPSTVKQGKVIDPDKIVTTDDFNLTLTGKELSKEESPKWETQLTTAQYEKFDKAYWEAFRERKPYPKAEEFIDKPSVKEVEKPAEKKGATLTEKEKRDKQDAINQVLFGMTTFEGLKQYPNARGLIERGLLTEQDIK